MKDVLLAVVPAIVGVAGLTVGVAAWDAAVFARRHFDGPRDRLVIWARDCGEVFETLHASDVNGRLGEAYQPPFRYGLRAYAHFDLLEDLDELENLARGDRRWNDTYVEADVVDSIRREMAVAGCQWRALHGAEAGWSIREDAEIRRSAGNGLQRVGMLQEQIQAYERERWYRTLSRRRRIASRRRERRAAREARHWQELRAGEHRSHTDWVPS